MKKHITITVILIILTIFSIVISNSIKNNQNNKSIQASKMDGVAIMVFDKATNNYVKQSEIPKGNYILNNEKSKCIGGSKFSDYDSKQGTLLFSLENSDMCYIYFDAVNPPLATYITDTVYNSKSNQTNIASNAAGLYKQHKD